MTHTLFITVSLFISFTGGLAKSCRCIAWESCFPSSKLWDEFNRTINGSLVRVTPPAYPCYDSQSGGNSCDEVRDNWSNSIWRSNQPGAAEHPNWETHGSRNCPVPRKANVSGDITPRTCHQGSVPVYAVNATTCAHVQAAIRFATQFRLRLVVKNTGHDYSGRSSARGSLSIWVHWIRSITFHDNYPTPRCDQSHRSKARSYSAVEVGVGVPWKELFEAADREKKLLVGPLSFSVGAGGGYVQGGGHSSLTPTYGFAADNVLQFEVVTPDGEIRTANPCVNEDLFWALRGGGGGTFGVVTSVVYRTHPPVQNIISFVQTIQANNSRAYRNLLAQFTRLQGGFNDEHWAGYFVLTGNTLIIRFLAINQTTDYVKVGAMKTLQDYVGIWFADVLNVVSTEITSFGSYLEWYNTEMCGWYGSNNCIDAVGINRALGTRLMPRTVLDTYYVQVADALISFLRSNGTANRILGIFVGGGVAAGEHDNAVNPAWRESLWHVTAEGVWEDTAGLNTIRSKLLGISNATNILREVTPTSGAYFNEADYYEPNWQQSLFGDKYTRLLEIKRKYDPDGLLVCWHCVGSEEWSDDLNCLVNSS